MPSYCLHEDAAGTLWFGTQGGLTRYKDGKLTAYTTREGLFHNMIYQILEDDQQNLWMSCNRGVFSLSIRAVDDFDRGRIPQTALCALWNGRWHEDPANAKAALSPPDGRAGMADFGFRPSMAWP